MFCDVFSKEQALKLLEGKRFWLIGSSNMRAIYKDLLWLLTHGSITPKYSFQIKNELNYLNDKRISNDTLHNGRNYKETREITIQNTHILFHFITRLYIDHFIDLINNTKSGEFPDVLLLNSCLWDLTRWGPDGPKNFRINILQTMKFLQSKLPAKTRVIWKTALPVSLNANGAIFVDEIKFIVPMLPWHILEANIYASSCANFFNYDTLDVHHHMRLQGHLRVKDGIHWQPIAVRYLTNLFLTHVCLTSAHQLPGNFKPNDTYLCKTTKAVVNEKVLENRLNEKQALFKKLFKKNANPKKKPGCLQGVTNKILAVSKKMVMSKKKNKKMTQNINSTHRNNGGNRNRYYPNAWSWNPVNYFNGQRYPYFGHQNYNFTHAAYRYNSNYANDHGNYYRSYYYEHSYYSMYNFPS